MIIEYIDHKISEDIKTEKHTTIIGKWLMKLMLRYNIFILNIYFPYKINEENITINKLIVTNSQEIDTCHLTKYVEDI